MYLTGGEAFQLTDAKNGVSGYEWSPDGSHIAYTMVDPLTEEEEKARKEKWDAEMVDQNYKYNHLYKIIVADNGDEENESERLTEGEFHIQGFNWSPDGRNIVFSHLASPLLNDRSTSNISVVSASGGEPTLLVGWEGGDNNPVYSPDGTKIAFTSSGGTVQDVGLSEIYILPSGGGEPVKPAETADRSSNILGWSSNGNEIYYSEPDGTIFRMFAMNVETGEIRTITSGRYNYGSISFSAKSDNYSFVRQAPEEKPQVYVTSHSYNRPVKLSNVNDEYGNMTMGKTEVLRWKSKDGMEIEGLLTYPVDYQEGQKYPVILLIHGGPAGVFTQGYTGGSSIYPLQAFAQKGYAVLRPNPRGSTGYGKNFRYANVKDWGFGDYEDVASGVDKVIEMGIGDPDNQFVMGWSYGGYLTSFTVTRTDRFNAASMGAGLPNLISMTTTTDIQDYLVAHMGGKEYWDDYKTYEKHSAIYRIKNVVTPTQILHGKNDGRVPTSQGIEFYYSLKRLGVDVEMILYPRTQHGPREPKFIQDIGEKIMLWFDKYKAEKPPGNN